MPSLHLPKSRSGRVVAAGLVASAAIAGGVQFSSAGQDEGVPTLHSQIKHVVVIFQENTSFDHVFGTYPNAANLPGEIPFNPTPGQYEVDGLTPTLLTANPNAGNPKRLGSADVVPTISCSNDHGYASEQNAMNGGLMDKFVQNTQGGGCGPTGVMNYFDGNTYTALWNYAQHYGMTDNQHGTGFGPSTIGAIQLVSGDTTTAVDLNGNPLAPGPGVNNHTIFSNQNPPVEYDGCSAPGTYALGTQFNANKNVGDLLNAKGVSWGWFQGGFDPTSRAAPSANYPVAGRPVCGSSHTNVAGAVQGDYDAHHNPFSYYKSTSNPEHLPPTGVVGQTDQANHNYDLTRFDAALGAGQLPAVSFLKASHYQDGHPGYSDPLDEQTFIVNEVNKIQSSPEWDSTAIFIAWDDSDGWYDHAAPEIVRGSSSTEDHYSGSGQCQPVNGATLPPAPALGTDRCGYGPRIPLIAISPYAIPNRVKHTVTDQTSVLKFIEDNWTLGTIGGNSLDVKANSLDSMFNFTGGAVAGKLALDPNTGAVPGTQRIPQPPVTNPTPPPNPPASPGTPALPKSDVGKIKCKAKVASTRKTVTLSCTTGKTATAKTSIRARLIKGKKTQLSTASTSLKAKSKSKKLGITLKTKGKIAKGSYTLTLTVSAVGFQPTSQTLKVKL